MKVHTSIEKRIAQVVTGVALLTLGAGCVADPLDPDDGSEGDQGEHVGEASEALSTPCRHSQRQIVASLANPARRRVVERGFAWWNSQVPYSQTRYHGGYRTDCSGFVSMAWQLDTSYTTPSFHAGAAQCRGIDDRDLLPGDALVRDSGGSGHMFLFLGWDDPGSTRACVLEQSSTANDMVFRTRTRSSMRALGYRAIRKDGV